MEVVFDEDEPTAQDYSILVSNPPNDAKDADAWNAFFSKFGQVTVCSVIQNNESLIKTLVKRRDVYEALCDSLPPGTTLSEENIAMLTAEIEASRSMLKRIFLSMLPINDAATLNAKLRTLDKKMRHLAGIDYKVTHVFLTFETEQAQRQALQILCVSRKKVNDNKSWRLNSEFLFRGKLVLDVSEPAEPCSINWEHINVSLWERAFVVLATTFVCIVSMILIFISVRVLQERSATYAAWTISITNAAFPEFAKVRGIVGDANICV